MDDKALVSAQPHRTLARVSLVARQVARQHALELYRSTLSPNTQKRHLWDMQVFANYLNSIGESITVDDLLLDLRTWEGANEGLLEGFKMWMLDNGYSIGSVNTRLATIKRYCAVAAKAGFVDPADLGLISRVYGYRGKESRNIDVQRMVTRVGTKKGAPTIISESQYDALLAQDDSRDALLMYFFLRLGFRVGEVAGLEVRNIDLENGQISIYREKTDKTQIHALRWDGLHRVRAYLDEYQPAGKLFHGNSTISSEDGSISTDYSIRGMQKRVKTLGLRVGLDNLSPHDCRHEWATRMARNRTHVKDMQTAGGWTSPAMPLRYAEDSIIANEGVIL